MLNMFNTKKDFHDSNCTVAILPVGALEQHGSHLPVGTDNIFAEYFARQIAEKLEGAYLLPVIPITSSIEHREGKGTVFVKADTLALIIRDIAESLRYAGFKQLIILNWHGGNWIIKPTIRSLNRELHPFEVILLDSGLAAHRHGEIFKHTKNDLHAGEMETSLMLYLHKNYVGEIRSQTNTEFAPQAFMDYFDVTQITEDGYWGYPEEATIEKGEKMARIFIECALEYLQEIERMKLKVKESESLL
ncbi:creatininase family protein [Lederbergia panacisoli]|uniref:creatininase family protein n=1 Tax=Lederbergia panacisoli TaxID=1255251 RepID=UPI00214ADC98|nr:creatininase family protein [Lederbergia panacisoli]MCR2821186.1 creatininase family protein [Lederbergia panacisoli]